MKSEIEILEFDFPLFEYKKFLNSLENKGIIKRESDIFHIVGIDLKIREDQYGNIVFCTMEKLYTLYVVRKNKFAKVWEKLDLKYLEKHGRELEGIFK